MTASASEIITAIRTRLSQGLSGFEARAHLLYLAYLHELPHERLERQVDQGTYHRYQPLDQRAAYVLDTAHPAQAPFLTPGFSAWCSGLSSRIKPVTPRTPKVRPTKRGADAAQ